MSEVAGKLEIPVESKTKGFGDRLKAAIEKEARGIAAVIEVKLDDAGLKQKLEEAAKEAARGVTAKIGVEIDSDGLKAKMAAAAKAAGADAKIKVVVEGLAEAVEKEKAKVEAENKSRRRWLRLPVRADGEGIVRSVLGSIFKGQAVADANPINVKVKAGGGGVGGKGGKGSDFQLPDWLTPKGNARSLFKPTMFLGIASLIQPAIAAIGGSIGGLAAMVANAAASINLLGGAGGAIGGLISSMVVLQLSFGGLFGKLEKVPEDLLPIRKEFEKLRPQMESFTKVVRGSFWNEWKGDIEKTGKVAMPIFRDGLAGVGKELGETAKQTAAWMRTPLFKRQTSSVFYTMRTVTDGFGTALFGAAKGMLNITQAAGPMLSKFGDVMRNFGVWANDIGNTSAEQGRLAASFDYAWTKAAQLWDMTKNLGASIKNVFQAGRQTGDNLLGVLQENIQALRDWTDSSAGQARLKDWFEAIEPIARAAGRLIVGLGAALARLAEDSHTAALLDKITTQLLPSLEKFLANLGGTLGPQVVEFITNVLTILTQMSAAGSPLGQGLEVINKMLMAVSSFLTEHDQLATNLGVLLGAFMAFRSLTFFTGIIPVIAKFFGLVNAGGIKSFGAASVLLYAFSGGLASIPKPLQAVIISMSAFLLMRTKLEQFGKTNFGGNLGAAFGMVGEAAKKSGGNLSKFRTNLSGLTGALGYGGGAKAGGMLKGALSGVMGMLGGPWNLAIGGAALAIGGFIQAQENARAAAQALSDTLDKQTGAFTQQTRDSAIQSFFKDFSQGDYAKVRQQLDDAGVGVKNLIAAYETGDPAKIQEFKDKFDAFRASQESWDGSTPRFQGNIEALGNSYAAFGRDMEAGRVIFNETKAATDGAAAAAESAGTKVLTYKEAHDALTKATDTARTAQDKLKAVLLGISDAEVDADSALSTYNQTLAEAKKGMGDYKVTLDKSTGGLALNTAAGRSNQGVLKGLRTDALANWQAMLKNGQGVDATRSAMVKAKGEFVAIATKMLGSKAAAEKMAAEYGYTTDTVDGLSKAIGDVPKQQKTKLTVETAAARAAVAAAKAAIASVRGAHVNVTATFKTLGLYGTLRAIQDVKNAGRPGWTIANGGLIEKFADGGIRAFGKRAEDRIAQIAKAGSYRVWAEDETGGEAYIPLAQSKRGRSMAILEEVAERFGMALSPLMERGTPGAMALASAAPSSPRAAAAAAGSRGAPNVTFEAGAFTINNPAPEPASRSVSDALRSVGEFGMFGED